ncbi:MAG: hypothetical protein EAX96_00450 [Candidatus Lokiarchaeota archaeon]|nr:hypothetical protein [Candidatus Lokiarchaeota archaeon]
MIEIPPKRKKLYEFIFKIMDLKKADEEKLEIRIENLNEFELLTTNLLEQLNSVNKNLIIKLEEIDNKKNLIKKIDNLEFFRQIEKELSNEKLPIDVELKVNILKILETKAQKVIEKGEVSIFSSKVTYLENLTAIDDILNQLKAKIDKEIEFQKLNISKNEENLTQIMNLFNKLDAINNFNEASPILKEYTTSFYSKNSSYIYSQLKKSYKNNKINDKRADILFNNQLKPNFIEAIILYLLSNFGNMSIDSMHIKTKLNSKRLFASLLSLIEKGLIIEVGEFEGHHIYSNNLLGNQLSKALESIKDKLNSYKIEVDKNIQVILPKLSLKLNNLIELSNNLIKINFKIYETELNDLEKILRALENLMPKKTIIDQDLKFKLDSMIEAYKMYRLPLIVEKDENLQKQLVDEQRISDTFETLLSQDYLKGKIIWAIKKFGPLNIIQLEAYTNIPRSKLFILLNILRMNDEIIIKDAHEEYQVFNIPRKPSTLEKFLNTFFDNLFKFIKTLDFLKEKSKNIAEYLFEINELINKIKGFLIEINKLNIDDENFFENEFVYIFEKIQEFNDKFLSLRSKVIVGERELDFSKLVPIKITKVDENYSSLIKPEEIIGFGTIESDEKKCISCGKCERICPENAAILEKRWNLTLLFEMNDEEINLLPENKREIIFLIKKMAKKRPSEIKLPKDILGFGKSVFDPIKCIACKECLEKCPNKAIIFEEVWNIPEIIKNLSAQKIF